jgi:hypothetical protein
MKFVPEDPFSGDHINTCRTRNQRLSIIPQQGIVFIEHRSVPIRVFEGYTVRRWYGRNSGRGEREIEQFAWHEISLLGTSLHSVCVLGGSTSTAC